MIVDAAVGRKRKRSAGALALAALAFVGFRGAARHGLHNPHAGPADAAPARVLPLWASNPRLADRIDTRHLLTKSSRPVVGRTRARLVTAAQLTPEAAASLSDVELALGAARRLKYADASRCLVSSEPLCVCASLALCVPL